jgi:hypothetical protein
MAFHCAIESEGWLVIQPGLPTATTVASSICEVVHAPQGPVAVVSTQK